MQIENKKLREDIDKKVAAIIKEKSLYKKSKKHLETQTEELNQSENTNAKLEKAIHLRKKHTQRLEADISFFQTKTQDGSSNENKELVTGATDKNNHKVMTMIEQRAKIYELRNSIKIWERKVEILKLSSKRVYTYGYLYCYKIYLHPAC